MCKTSLVLIDHKIVTCRILYIAGEDVMLMVLIALKKPCVCSCKSALSRSFIVLFIVVSIKINRYYFEWTMWVGPWEGFHPVRKCLQTRIDVFKAKHIRKKASVLVLFLSIVSMGTTELTGHLKVFWFFVFIFLFNLEDILSWFVKENFYGRLACETNQFL